MRTSTVFCGNFGNQFDFSQESLEFALCYLPDTSFRESILRYQNHNQKWMSLLGRQLLFKGLAELGHPINETTVWSKAIYGRPYIKAFPDFNISHSGELAVCAIGEKGKRVGIDIQREKNLGPRLLNQVFTAQELDWVAGKKSRAARLWSRKEAVTKLLGLGMRVNFRKLEALSNQVTFEGKSYYLQNIPVSDGYQCTLAGETPLDVQLNLYHWSSLNQMDKY
ncbi:4'-phosphopantetheinyl transferase family protein [Neolewinella agarilytica]|uniref:4'-phosphopantetheinyl transferase n=1 Tax=Neolewinella agarilytica TaxID=478744 RepID=A0A1H9AJQ4_9BACT|nr:4'-phosphopantetheinyl transferase superfamily protein [Neolewinella agarilytica]SEP76805.1 4'-phosphopantetheinyl transferase [Neolewinella agarilytica]